MTGTPIGPTPAAPAGPVGRRGPHARSHGQATVEAALLLPFVVIATLVVLQFALVGRVLLQIEHAAREGARVAAVGGSPPDIRRAARTASALDPTANEVVIRTGATTVTVTVHHRIRTDLPLVGVLLPDPTISASATMRRER